MEILRGRSLDERERAALQILELAYEATSNPPCNSPEALRRHTEKLDSINAPGWSRLLKILEQIRLGYANPDYISAIKRGIMRTIDKCSDDNLSICYFALTTIEKAKPLCGQTLLFFQSAICSITRKNIYPVTCL